MAEIRNGMVVVRSREEEALLLAAACDAPSYESLGVGATTTYGVPAAGGGLVRRRNVSGNGYNKNNNSGSSINSNRPPSPMTLGCFQQDQEAGEEPHFLDSCSLCKRPLGTNRDIFMYRGNVPFCSEECRQDQIDTDEMKDRKWSNLAAKAMLSAAAKKAPVSVRATGTVVAG